MEKEVKLIGSWASQFSCRVEIALKLKGIDYQFIQEDLSNKSDLLLKYNPVHKKIPVLAHNGKPIAESLVILEYIDETWPDHPVLPNHPYDRAIARFWAKFIDEKLAQTIYKVGVAICKGEEKEEPIQELYESLKLLENELKGKEFFGGDKIGYLDIVAIVIAHTYQLMFHEILQIEFTPGEKFPVLNKWLEKLRQIDVIKECLPPKDKHIAHMKIRFETIKSTLK
ncbi:probable glutathione S-transferase [Mercurialis annua]|uniref:probable glutathione S-transferase n=1 Tax=Mercurialis annua TaxID=3986 RepID=UPI00215FF42C|nr:probable glutathione S-transferase [Mercurialis annua]